MADLPHSPEAERAVLGAVLLEPALLDDLPLGTTDFFLERHQLVFEACRELAADRSPIDVLTVQAHLERHGHLERAGGVAFLAALDTELPDLSRASDYAAIVLERARRRRLLEIGQRLERRVQTGTAEASAIARALRREIEDLEGSADSSSGLSGSEVARQAIEHARQCFEQRERTGRAVLGLETGIPRLDQLLGGLQQGLYLLAGAPGVGKTTLALQIALNVARHAPVVYLTFENSARNLVTKTLCGLADVNPREARRGFVPAVRLHEAAENLEACLRNILFIDGSGATTIASARTQARRRLEQAGVASGLVVVDYLQLWAKTSRELRGLSDTRAKVEALGGDLIDLSRRLSSPVLALASQSRAGGAYGRGGGEASLDSLKESGDLEYAADVALFLTPPKERKVQPPAVALDLTIAKNREGPTGMVELVARPDRGTVREVVGEG